MTNDPATPANALDWLNAFPTRGLPDTLGIQVVELTKERAVVTMPVDSRTHQPFGLLHGGASVALAETAASLGGLMHVDQDKSIVVGLEINANHVRPKKSGIVTATATPAHIGKSTHVWSITIADEDGKSICISRCTLAVVPIPPK